MSVFIEGFILCMSLIVAIGPQNAFVLKNGIRRKFIFTTPLTTSLCDTVLILLSVFGFGQFINNHEVAKIGLKILGVTFLFIYSIRCMLNSLKKKSLDISEADSINSFRKVILYAIGFSFLNPHAILDTIVIVSSVSSSHSGNDVEEFCMGLIAASFIWFFAISFFASKFSQYLARPIVWKIIDLSVSIICIRIAYNLLKDLIA